MVNVQAYGEAIRMADLPHPKKVLLFTLLSLADPETGLIPEKRQPGYTKLAKYAGLGRSTTIRLMPQLKEDGWFKVSVPNVQASWQDKETNSYLLTIPEALTGLGAGLVPERDQSQSETSSTSPGAGLVPERDVEMPDSRAGLVPERDRTSPAAGRAFKNLSTSSSSSGSSSSSASPPKPDPKTKIVSDDEAAKPTSKASKTVRGTRIPDDFWPDEDMIAWAKEHTPKVGKVETHAFIDYFKSAPGQKGVKVDWVATWRGWMRREQKRIQEQLDREARYAAARGQGPATSPKAVPADEKCDKHPGKRKDNCGLCRAERAGRRDNGSTK
ncbi:hypothetical protein [Micromonospora maritima]|uniref:hypothetical protein n=1 Tax=Micromonospora maritima TaxID=986711 RepID=UPI00157BC9E7|nr:hypothetical protein [Micromonospora maritima]